MIQDGKKAVLLLENGTELVGKSCGAEGTAMGETVFTTAMVGYQETLTDSAFYGKLVTQTFPLIGNYGVNSFDDEAPRCYAAGYIIREWCEVPSNFRSEGNINDYLKRNGIVGIYDIDTRKLTKILREEGEMNGVITTGEYDREALLKELRAFQITDTLKAVSVSASEEYKAEDGMKKVAVLDFGVHKCMIESLNRNGCDVTVLPHDTSAEAIEAAGYNGVLLPDGPGDPSGAEEVIHTVKELCDRGMPIAGVGLGHLVLALANGGKVKKLHYGHRGGNQPVIDLAHGRTYVTSQNHGFVVEEISPETAQVSFHNANDKTCEGLKYLHIPAVSVQFMPEEGFYREFVFMMDNKS